MEPNTPGIDDPKLRELVLQRQRAARTQAIAAALRRHNPEAAAAYVARAVTRHHEEDAARAPR